MKHFETIIRDLQKGSDKDLVIAADLGSLAAGNPRAINPYNEGTLEHWRWSEAKKNQERDDERRALYDAAYKEGQQSTINATNPYGKGYPVEREGWCYGSLRRA